MIATPMKCRLLALACVFSFGVFAAEPARPNILLIMVDDLGYGDLGCYGGKLAATPHLDRLAAEGVRFTSGYVTAATCAPSRLGLMTGVYQQRFGAYNNAVSRSATIPSGHLLMPEMLRKAGYRTAHIGKWNVNRPAKTVFDEVHNEIDWESDYYPGPDGRIHGMETGDKGSSKHQGWSTETNVRYATDIQGDSAAEFVRRQRGARQPFFLCLSFNAVHSPWQAPLELKEKYAHLSHPVLQLYAAMLDRLDHNVGKVFAALETSGFAESTLVLFVSDNGPEWGRDYIKGWKAEWSDLIVGSAGEFSGRKAQFLEGGIRVPFILRWPARVKGGAVYAHPVSALDAFATFAAAAGHRIDQVADGVNLVPFLTGERPESPHEALFWSGDPKTVHARMGDWKAAVPAAAASVKLYNLATDPGEQTDVANRHPETAARIVALVAEWRAKVSP
jgi:arylsulfatase A-like enzyme